MEYHKLVRDKIPEIISKNGERADFRTLDKDEYIKALELKLDAEVGEFHESRDMEELADILEVVYALAEVHGCSKAELMSIYETKNEKRGGFQNRIFLISKHENETENK